MLSPGPLPSPARPEPPPHFISPPHSRAAGGRAREDRASRSGPRHAWARVPGTSRLGESKSQRPALRPAPGAGLATTGAWERYIPASAGWGAAPEAVQQRAGDQGQDTCACVSSQSRPRQESFLGLFPRL